MSQDEQGYVGNSAWLRQVGRVDAIDDIADQFERRPQHNDLGQVAG